MNRSAPGVPVVRRRSRGGKCGTTSIQGLRPIERHQGMSQCLKSPKMAHLILIVSLIFSAKIRISFKKINMTRFVSKEVK